MNTKLLMISSAVMMGVAGIIFSFLPQELLNYGGVNPTQSLQLILQMIGALYLGFALLNWMAKGNVIGGIYSRPIVMGNFMHFVVGGLTLIKFFSANPGMKMILIPAIIYLLFSLLFAFFAFWKSPVN